ncbi:MAG: T9SS type A sorting domain-containing protein [Clostridium sp.]|nr:T9SS type A sorting domain-containing protein [Clostridium sp.]
MKSKHIFLTLLTALPLTAGAQGYDVSNGTWKLHLDYNTKKIDIKLDGKALFNATYAEAVDFSQGKADTLRSYNAEKVTPRTLSTEDELGNGKVYEYIYTMSDGRYLRQTFGFYPDVNYAVLQLYLGNTGGETLTSNYLAPLCTTNQTTFLPTGGTYRMLQVPLDNDHFVSYYSQYLRGELGSYSTTAIFDGKSRQGLVCGAIDHDIWKNGIAATCPSKADGSLNTFSCFSGAQGYPWMDGREHGRVSGTEIHSARFILGMFSDWRDGMETFAEACCKVAPPYEWEGGKPVGWSSWGVQQNYITQQSVFDVSDFIAQELTPKGFHDTEGKTVISLDAFWNDNLTPNNKAIPEVVEHCKENNQIPGIYMGLFCDFAKDPNRTVQGTSNKYHYKDIWLKVNGEPWELDGAYCLDPTHPATKLAIKYDLQRFYEWGIRYVKADFMSHGIIEADSYYNKNVTTGVQAYNEGMQFMNDVLKKYEQADDRMYVLLSISPIFPYQYAPARRICCDSWGTIDQTQYEMNSLSLGWWLDRLYHANDPDHMVMHLIDGGAKESIGVNRARLTSGVATGSYITGDNYSFSNGQNMNEPKGYPQQARERALQLLTNNEVTKIVRSCPGSFRPLNGYHATKEDCADNFLVNESKRYFYVAAINYGKILPISGTLNFADLGISADNVGEIRELWLGENVSHTSSGFSYQIPASDARIYRIEKKDYASHIASADDRTSTEMTVIGRTLRVELSSPSAFTLKVYDLQGRCQLTETADTRLTLNLNQLPHGCYVAEVVTANKQTILQKFIL